MTLLAWVLLGIGAGSLLLAALGKRHGGGHGSASLNPLDWVVDWLVDLLPEPLWRGVFVLLGVGFLGCGLREGGVL